MRLSRTTYDRSRCKIGVVHLGFGGFHRSHQAVYFDDYMECTSDLNWSIAAVNLSESDSREFCSLYCDTESYDGYILRTTSASGDEDYRLVRSHSLFVDWISSASRAESLFSSPDVHLVTITITESGYTLNADDVEHTKNIYVFLSNALSVRQQTCDAPLTIICCDNIINNGSMLQNNFFKYLELTNNTDLKSWVSSHVTFPGCMVDRITPRPTFSFSTDIQSTFPDYPTAAVYSESFIQWVIEDNFASIRPGLDSVGVEFVPDVHPYEDVKLRILNGGHTCLAYFGVLRGHTTYDEAIMDSSLRDFFDSWQAAEALPGITRSLPFDKYAYKDLVTHRFCNSAIADTLDRICMDGFAKISIFLKPTIESCLQQDIVPLHSYRIIASWYIYARRISQGTLDANYIEPGWKILLPYLEQGRESDFATLSLLWDDLPIRYPDFAPDILTAISDVDSDYPPS